jgi:hypothetical protein
MCIRQYIRFDFIFAENELIFSVHHLFPAIFRLEVDE